MRITIAHFGTHYVGMPGGVEKLCCALSSHLVKKGDSVTILYRDSMEGAPYFPIDPKVKQINILFDHGKQIVSERLPGRLRVYREVTRLFSQSAAQGINAKYKGQQYGPLIRKWMKAYPADVVISCSAPSTKYVITDAGVTVPVITLFRGDPVVQMPLLSKEERAAVAQSTAIQVLWPSKMSVSKKYFPDVPVVSIGNAVFPAEAMAHPGEKKEKHVISCVGNVSGRKNQKLLAQAFALLAKDYPDWSVEFWGTDTSHYAKSLGEEIKAKGLSGQVKLMGKTNRIGSVYERSDIFCITSTSEGFPQGLAEAMSAGLPAVGLSVCGGTNELIQDGKTGFLVENSKESVAAALKKLMEDPSLRASMGQAGHESVQQYRPEKMWVLWEDLLRKAAGKNR